MVLKSTTGEPRIKLWSRPKSYKCERIEDRNAVVVWSQGVYFIRPWSYKSRRWTNVIKTLLQCLVSAGIFLFSPLLCPLYFSHYVFFPTFLFAYSIKHEYTHSNGRALQNSCNIAKLIERFCKKIRTKLSAFLWEERLLSLTSIMRTRN